MGALTVLGGKGFVGRRYVREYYDAAVGNIVSVNDKMDLTVHSKDVLYFISTVHNFNVLTDPFLDVDTNLTTLLVTLESWRKYQERAGCKDGVFNFISSWFVYGKQSWYAKESFACRPKGFYSSTKLCAENLLIAYCEAHGFNYRILRLANVVGSGDDKVSEKKNALQHLIGKLKSGQEVVLQGRGAFHRDFIHVDDCIRAIELVINKGPINNIYNVGNGCTWKFGDIIHYLHGHLNSESKIVEVDGEVEDFHMNTDKIKALGYVPRKVQNTLYESLCEEA